MNHAISGRLFSVVLALGTAFGLPPAYGAPGSGVPEPPGNLITLPMPPSSEACDAWDINESGVIVGNCNLVGIFGDAVPVPVRWSNDGVEALIGPLRVTATDGTITDHAIKSGLATAINESGRIAAQITVVIGTHAAVWDDQLGVWHDLGIPAGSLSAIVRDIDDEGRVIGTTGRVGGASATVWSNGVVTLLPLLAAGRRCLGFAANESGEVVGECDFDSSGKRVPVIWKKGEVLELQNPRNPNTIDFARTINERGLIGGTASLSAIVWSANNAGKSVPVAALGTVNGVNDRDVMVGFLGVNDGSGILQAAWWRNPGQTAVLIAPGYRQSFARAISQDGAVVGFVEDGTQFAFVAR